MPLTYSLTELPELACSETLIAGVDEVGRGALFGPVVAAAVILPKASLEALGGAGARDSKLLSPRQRQRLYQDILDHAIAWRIGYATVAEIDEINILQASLLAMRRAVNRLQPQPERCLVDGKQPLPDLLIPQMNLIGGDRRSLLIAAASIIAKVWRDELIGRWAVKYPDYGLEAHKGYGTAKHLQALQQYGTTPQHRLSFSPCRRFK